MNDRDVSWRESGRLVTSRLDHWDLGEFLMDFVSEISIQPRCYLSSI